MDRGEEELECEQEVEQLDLAWLVSAATARCCATLLLLHVIAHQHAGIKRAGVVASCGQRGGGSKDIQQVALDDDDDGAHYIHD